MSMTTCQAREPIQSTIDWDTLHNELTALAECTREIRNALKQVNNGEMPDSIDKLIARRQGILENLRRLGETHPRTGEASDAPQEIRDLMMTIRDLGEESVQLLQRQRARLLEEIKKTDRYRNRANPYRGYDRGAKVD